MIEKELVPLGYEIDIKRVRIKETLDVHIVDMVSRKILLSGTVNLSYPKREKDNLDYWDEGFLYAMHLVKPNFSWSSCSVSQKELDEFLK